MTRRLSNIVALEKNKIQDKHQGQLIKALLCPVEVLELHPGGQRELLRSNTESSGDAQMGH